MAHLYKKIVFTEKALEFILQALGYSILNDGTIYDLTHGVRIAKEGKNPLYDKDPYLKAKDILGIHKDYGFITKDDVTYISNNKVILKEIK